MVDLWFGDSYVLGSELATHLGPYSLNDKKHMPLLSFVRKQDRPDLAFPDIVSNHRNITYINYGIGASSIETQLNLLTTFCKHTIIDDIKYTAFFCLPLQERRFTIKNNREIKQICTRKFWQNNSDLEHNFYDTTIVLNSIYNICLRYNITPYFIPTYSSVMLLEEFNQVPDSAWLIHRDTCLTQVSWNFKDIINWRSIEFKSNLIYRMYVSPCRNHPNTYGHQALADTILLKLKSVK